MKKWLLPLLGVLFFSCAAPAPSGSGLLIAKGTVKHVPLEGGFYGIEANDGTHYDPVEDLPEKFRKPGMRVKFKARKNENLVGAHMWGVHIEILEIEAA
jgi:hypothetical protein